MSQIVFLAISAAFAVIVAMVTAFGFSFTLKLYRGRYGDREKEANKTLGVTVALFLIALVWVQHFVSGLAGEVLSSGLMLCILVGGIVRIVSQLREKS